MEKIFIVEDDLSFGTIIQTWLRKKGFEVEKTTSVKSAIAAWEETAKQGNAARGFDLVLSDLRLPDKDGIFLLRWMREHGMKVPFIVMTSYAEIQNVVLAMKSGATDYIAKPFHPDILLDKIHEALNARKQSANSTSTPEDGGAKDDQSANPPKYIEGESEASRKLYSYVSLVALLPCRSSSLEPAERARSMSRVASMSLAPGQASHSSRLIAEPSPRTSPPRNFSVT